jgi:hypothetical protein
MELLQLVIHKMQLLLKIHGVKNGELMDMRMYQEILIITV